MSEAPQLAALYRPVAESIDMKELIDRTSKTLLRSIDNELTEIKSALIAVDDIATKEYRDLHFRGRVLAACRHALCRRRPSHPRHARD